jgi:hypothetical protein
MARGYLDPQQSLRTRAEWRRWEQVGLEPELDLDELVLNWPDQRIPTWTPRARSPACNWSGP